jgi:hypothetical protein
MAKKATFVKNIEGWTADAKLYKVTPSVEHREGELTAYVIVSAAVVPFSGPETYIFPANEDGDVLNWGELDGSYRGGLDHEEALRGAGYEVK